MYKMKSESILIGELREGSQTAFKCIYDLYVGRLYSFALSYCKSRENTQELVEDTFVWLWNNRDCLKEVDSLQSILFIRLRHFLVNAYRKTLRSPVFRDYMDYREALAESSVDSNLEYDDFVRLFNRSLEQVSATQRRIIVMARMEGIGIVEIAEELHLTEQTVRNQLSLGLKKMRQLMKDSYWIAALLFFVNHY